MEVPGLWLSNDPAMNNASHIYRSVIRLTANLMKVLLLVTVAGCKATADHDMAECMHLAQRLAGAAEFYHESNGHYPKSFDVFVIEFDLPKGVVLPVSGDYIDFEYGVESGRDYLFTTSQSISGKWLVVYPGQKFSRLNQPP